MSLNTLQEAHQNYQAARQQVLDRQESWQNEVKAFIRQSLEALKMQNQLDGEIKEENKITNIEAIYLDLGQTKTEIQVKNGAERKTLKRSEGSLMYSQLYNGKISVWIRYPKIQKLMKRKAPKVLDVYEPLELTAEQIEAHVKIFYEELTLWINQQTAAQRPIGF